MNTPAIQTQTKPSALALMASRFSVEPQKLLSTLKATVFKNATDDELLALVVVANEYGLNPLTKEIYAFPAKGGGIVPVVSIDGWINRANSHPQFDGIEFEDRFTDGEFVACTCTIWRKDRTHPIRVTEYLAECKRNTEPWKMEHRMLRHKALIQCVRVAFGFSGVHDEDDAVFIAAQPTAVKPVIDVTPKKKPSPADDIDMTPAPAEPLALTAEPTPQERLAIAVEEAGHTSAQALAALVELKLASKEWASLNDMPAVAAETALRDLGTLIKTIGRMSK